MAACHPHTSSTPSPLRRANKRYGPQAPLASTGSPHAPSTTTTPPQQTTSFPPVRRLLPTLRATTMTTRCMRTRHWRRRSSPHRRTCTSNTIPARSNAARATRHLLPTQPLAQRVGSSLSHSQSTTATQMASTPSANSHFPCQARLQRTTNKKHPKERWSARIRLQVGWAPTRSAAVVRSAGAGVRRYSGHVPHPCSMPQYPRTTFHGRLQAAAEALQPPLTSTMAASGGGLATTPPRTRASVCCGS